MAEKIAKNAESKVSACRPSASRRTFPALAGLIAASVLMCVAASLLTMSGRLGASHFGQIAPSTTASSTRSIAPVQPADARKSAIRSLRPVPVAGALLSAASAERFAGQGEPAGSISPSSGQLSQPFAVAAVSVAPNEVAADAIEPPAETQRQSDDESGTASNRTPVEVVSGFVGSTPVCVQVLSSTHLSLTITTNCLQDWFMFRLHGAAGRTVRIDLKTSDTIKHHWGQINPVFAAADDLDDPKLYEVISARPGPARRAWNGALLPSDDVQKWHFISDCWMPNEQTFCMLQHFASDTATIAMRVPYLPGFSAAALRQIRTRKDASVVEVGRSQEGRPLTFVNIADDPTDTQRPCVLIYAGEHADEQDAMWVAHGAIRYLLGPSPDAADLRHRFRFIVIPQLDPDSAAVSRHNGIVISFMADRETPESRAYANWFQGWIDGGNHVDLVLDLHNMQGGEMPTDLSCAWMEGVGARGNLCAAMHAQLLQDADAAGLKCDKTYAQRAWSPDRLGGWLSRRYGPIGFLYEVNAQQQDRHLSLGALQDLGGLFVRSSTVFLDGPSGLTLRREVDRRLAERAERWSKSRSQVPAGSSAIVGEAIVSRGVGLAANGTPAEKWVP